jgi:PAS domain S-box-containing protein
MRQPIDTAMTTSALQTAILNCANLAVIATDNSGMIQLFNVGSERLLGYRAQEIIQQRLPDALFAPQELAQYLAAQFMAPRVMHAPSFELLAHKASLGEEDVFEMTLLCKDGSPLSAVVSLTALSDGPGHPIGFLLALTDNSARKKVEEALKATTLMAETASKAKSDFLSRMSHELRTPLNTILGFAQLLESGTPKPAPVQAQSIGQILKAGWYLLSLINEVLDLTLVESGHMTLLDEPVLLGDIVDDCEAMLVPQAARYRIRMNYAKPDVALHVIADRNRVKQVLINLLMNGIKYNRPGGSVSLDFSLDVPAKVRIHIRDSGLGMTQTQVAHLFQPFNRLGREASGEEGTGVGLVLAKRLVEMMGGEIGVESTPGSGSVFWIDLPRTTLTQAAPGSAPARTALPVPHASSKPMYTVLCVEDNPANLALVAQIIARRHDVHFLGAPDASVGIALARARSPDLILMDIHLPGLGGIDALNILRADPRTAHVPIIALSANATPQDIARGRDAGFFDYVTKPILVQGFMRTLDAALTLTTELRKLSRKMETNQ